MPTPRHPMYVTALPDRRVPGTDRRYRAAVTILLLATFLGFALPCLALGQVAARDLPRGTVLAADDVEAPVDDGAIAGWVTQRAIRAGEPLAAPAIAPPRLVRRGESVMLVYDDGMVRVARRGDALRDAALHDACSVRVPPLEPGLPHRVFSGRVIAAGVVALDRATPSLR